jgi:hypothetical protein
MADERRGLVDMFEHSHLLDALRELDRKTSGIELRSDRMAWICPDCDKLFYPAVGPRNALEERCEKCRRAMLWKEAQLIQWCEQGPVNNYDD